MAFFKQYQILDAIQTDLTFFVINDSIAQFEFDPIFGVDALGKITDSPNIDFGFKGIRNFVIF
ncbi:MAG: hypothetical protein R3A11_03270 [Bdellovibrionota bacterium]